MRETLEGSGVGGGWCACVCVRGECTMKQTIVT